MPVAPGSGGHCQVAVLTGGRAPIVQCRHALQRVSAGFSLCVCYSWFFRLSQSALTAITTDVYHLTVLEGGGLRSKCGQGWFINDVKLFILLLY